MNYFFAPEAEDELQDAIAYYEKCQEELGLDFAAEVYSAINRVIAYPKAWPVLHNGNERRCQTERFPFGIIYSEQLEGIYVLAIMHLHKEPGYWKHRR